MGALTCFRHMGTLQLSRLTPSVLEPRSAANPTGPRRPYPRTVAVQLKDNKNPHGMTRYQHPIRNAGTDLAPRRGLCLRLWWRLWDDALSTLTTAFCTAHSKNMNMCGVACIPVGLWLWFYFRCSATRWSLIWWRIDSPTQTRC